MCEKTCVFVRNRVVSKLKYRFEKTCTYVPAYGVYAAACLQCAAIAPVKLPPESHVRTHIFSLSSRQMWSAGRVSTTRTPSMAIILARTKVSRFQGRCRDDWFPFVHASHIGTVRYLTNIFHVENEYEMTVITVKINVSLEFYSLRNIYS